MSGRGRSVPVTSAPAGSTAHPIGTSPLVLYDDATARSFEPFALTRPIGTLAAGTAEIYKRWQTVFQIPCAGVIAAPHLTDFDEAPGTVKGILPAGTIVANSRFAPALELIARRGRPDGTPISRDAHAGSWRNGSRVAAVRLRQAMAVADLDGDATLDSLADGKSHSALIDGWWQDEIWDFIRHLAAVLTDDIEKLRAHGPVGLWKIPDHVTVIGDHAALVWGSTSQATEAPPATLESHVILDASAGPILIEAGASIHAFARIVGPCRIGAGATVMGGEVRACSIGTTCKIRGELSNTIMLGYSNKGHDGFVGHSYLGRWVNLGAGTTTSNLKNTYGPVSMWTPSGIRDTGLQFLGTMFGDHVKTGIGTLLTTGTVIGAGANVFGSQMPPKAVGSSRVDLQACKLEYSIVSPK